MISVLIADDHAILRRGLKEILAGEIEGVICGEAENAAEVLTQVQTEHWDVLILDITMPGRSGLDVLLELRRLKPQLPVLVLSVHPEEQYGKRVLKAGAAGYMNKETAPEELIKALKRILAGGRYVSAVLAESLAGMLQEGSGGSAHDRLSPREFEILRMIASGRTIGEIAKELDLGATTVSTHRQRILKKMNLATNADLIRYALHHRLID